MSTSFHTPEIESQNIGVHQSISVALLDGHECPVKRLAFMDWDELTHLISCHQLGQKTGAAWMPAYIEPGPRNSKRVRHVSVLVMDVEADAAKMPDGLKRVTGPLPPSIEELAKILSERGWSAVLTTSYSHEEPTPHSGTLGPRYRLALQVSRPLEPNEVRLLGLHVADLMGIVGSIDRGCLEPARLFYLARYPAEREHLAKSIKVPGQPLDVPDLLAGAAIEANPQHHARVGVSIQTNVIDAFNSVNQLPDLLRKHNYLEVAENRWKFSQSTTDVPGVLYLPDTKRVVSYHANDPLHAPNAKGGVHSHDYFGAWCRLEHGGNLNVAVRKAAEILGIEQHKDPTLMVKSERTNEWTTGVHPLAQFVPIDGPVRPPKWLIPGFVAEGLVTIAGEPAVGKTTCILPLSLVAAHLCSPDNPLRPKHWRHVIFISEDVEQARRVLKGVCDHGEPKIAEELLKERFHMVEATRLGVDDVVQVGAVYRALYTRMVDGVELLPLVVFDTKSAILHSDNEDDNAEASAAVAALKQQFEGLPTWVIGHVSKSLKGRTAAKDLSMRGASAWEGDVHQTMFIVNESGQRFIVQGKRRFESTWPELIVKSYTSEVDTHDEFGEPCCLTLRWGLPAPSDVPRQVSKEAVKQQAKLVAYTELKSEIASAVEASWLSSQPVNRTGIRELVRRNAADVNRAINELLKEFELYEVSIPGKFRTNPQRASYFVRLSHEERLAVIRGDALPPEKLVIPKSMMKPGV